MTINQLNLYEAVLYCLVEKRLVTWLPSAASGSKKNLTFFLTAVLAVCFAEEAEANDNVFYHFGSIGFEICGWGVIGISPLLPAPLIQFYPKFGNGRCRFILGGDILKAGPTTLLSTLWQALQSLCPSGP